MRFGSRTLDSLLSSAARRHPPDKRERELAVLGLPGTVVLESLAAALTLRKDRPAALATALAGPFALASSTVVKELVRRPRPGLARFRRKGRQSFPSTHVAGPFALLGCLSQVAPRTAGWRVLLLAGTALAVAIGVERVQAEEHWCTDVLAGTVWGAIVGLAIGRIAKSAARRRQMHGDGMRPSSP